jgi:hypothetical protein
MSCRKSGILRNFSDIYELKKLLQTSILMKIIRLITKVLSISTSTTKLKDGQHSVIAAQLTLGIVKCNSLEEAT